MKKSFKWILLFLIILLFLSGMAIMLYPYFQGASAETTMKNNVQSFYEWRKEIPAIEEATTDQPVTPETVTHHSDLLADMQTYNDLLWQENQAGLKDPWSYTKPSFSLTKCGLENDIFGVVSIPKLELEMPLYLGTTSEHLAAGAAHLSQTSLPIGGQNTNCVIAGHCGYGGADYFRYITNLQPGDTVTIINLWKTLTYTVYETKIINPNEVKEILIQEGKDLLTLLTCHPYASGGKYRYLVFCHRTS